MNLIRKKRGKSRSKVVSGGVKRRSWKKVGFLSMVGVLLLTSVGYGGYVQWQKNRLKAHAGGWTYLGWAGGNGSNPGIAWMRACKSFVPVYGGVYNVSFQAYRSSKNVWAVVAYNPGSRQWVRNDQWGYGVLSGVTVSASAYYNQPVLLTVQTLYGDRGAIYNRDFNINPKVLVNC